MRRSTVGHLPFHRFHYGGTDSLSSTPSMVEA